LHLKHQVPVIRYDHEFGDRGATKDSMVVALKVSDHKVDVVGTEVVCLPNYKGRVICPRGIELCLGRTP
jgi:hypothetical protein